ncbi:MAG: 50S ribosomal protein L6 [Methanosarcinales archaeon]|nr:50S ribosomal protein L6 [Methanosarcinales archaeon]
MGKELKKVLDIPEGVEVVLKDNNISVNGPKGAIHRELWYPGVVIDKKDNKIIINLTVNRKKQQAMLGTITSHIRNMINGVTGSYTYLLKVVYSHFPIQLKVDENYLNIGNFLGEKKPRKAKIIGDTTVEVKGNEVVVEGINIEHVGQTAANIQQATKIKRFDPRVFQDGIYLVEKTRA